MSVQRFLALALLFALTALTACGTQDATTEAASPTTVSDDVTTTVAEEDDHDDEDHDDEDHDDEDHDDEDHDDEDHDDDHDDHDNGGLGAHEHGTAEMTVAWIGGDVTIELISPTYNVFGFEYEPETDDDIAFAAAQTELLTAPGTMTINDDASCTLADPVETATEQEGTHSEITASWSFTCDSPDDVSVVDATALFAAFPNFEDIDVQWISDTNQSSAELTPDTPTLTLER